MTAIAAAEWVRRTLPAQHFARLMHVTFTMSVLLSDQPRPTLCSAGSCSNSPTCIVTMLHRGQLSTDCFLCDEHALHRWTEWQVKEKTE